MMLNLLPTWRNAMLCRDDTFVVVNQSKAHKDEIPKVFDLPKLHDIDLFEVSVDELQHHFSGGSFTSYEYIAFCLEQIRKVSRSWRPAVFIAQRQAKD